MGDGGVGMQFKNNEDGVTPDREKTMPETKPKEETEAQKTERQRAEQEAQQKVNQLNSSANPSVQGFGRESKK